MELRFSKKSWKRAAERARLRDVALLEEVCYCRDRDSRSHIYISNLPSVI